MTRPSAGVFSREPDPPSRRYQRVLRQRGVKHLVERAHESRVELTELGVQGRGLVVAHRVDTLFQVIDVHSEERDAPLPIIETRGTGDDLEDPALELTTERTVLTHQALAIVVGQGVPVVRLVAAFRHGVETERSLAVRGKRREEPVLQHLLGHAGRVLADLGDRHVALSHEKAGRLDPRLKLAQRPEVLTQDHETYVGLRAHDGDAHHLEALTTGVVDGLSHGARVDVRAGVTEQVQYVKPARGRERFWSHGPMLRPHHEHPTWTDAKMKTVGPEGPTVPRLSRIGRSSSRPFRRRAWPRPSLQACRRSRTRSSRTGPRSKLRSAVPSASPSPRR